MGRFGGFLDVIGGGSGRFGVNRVMLGVVMVLVIFVLVGEDFI